MEASNSRSRIRPVVVDFLATLFITFCIGVATAVVLALCVMLMAGEARGAAGGREPMKMDTMCERVHTDAVHEGAPTEKTRARAIEFALTHQLVTKYTGLVAIDRTPAR